MRCKYCGKVITLDEESDGWIDNDEYVRLRMICAGLNNPSCWHIPEEEEDDETEPDHGGIAS
jgi:hypothetical protein